jgi:hypothetical protein
VIEADDALLADGFHTYEADVALRRTDGDAVLPAALFAGLTGPTEVLLQCSGSTLYAEDGNQQSAAA